MKEIIYIKKQFSLSYSIIYMNFIVRTQVLCFDEFVFYRPIRQHFIPNLDQIRYEIEDGVTPEGAQIRYGYDDRLFPRFSWRGYAILTTLQVITHPYISQHH